VHANGRRKEVSLQHTQNHKEVDPPLMSSQSHDVTRPPAAALPPKKKHKRTRESTTTRVAAASSSSLKSNADLLGLFIAKKTTYAIDSTPNVSSGRVLIPEDIREKLEVRKQGITSCCKVSATVPVGDVITSDDASAASPITSATPRAIQVFNATLTLTAPNTYLLTNTIRQQQQSTSSNSSSEMGVNSDKTTISINVQPVTEAAATTVADAAAAAANVNVPTTSSSSCTPTQEERQLSNSNSNSFLKTTKKVLKAAPDFMPFSSSSSSNDLQFVKKSLPSWCSKPYASPLPALRLHQECMDFVEWVRPNADELRARRFVISQMKSSIAALFPGFRVKVYGSMKSGLMLPSSDIDLMVLPPTNEKYVLTPEQGLLILRVIEREIRTLSIAAECRLADTARVPVLKFCHVLTRIDVDITVNTLKAFQNTKRCRGLLSQYAAAAPLTIIIKFFLRQRDFNELFTGGLGSHAVLLMVISFLQQRRKFFLKPENSKQRSLHSGLGSLLVEFFDYYGNQFNFPTVGIRVANGGSLINIEQEILKRPFAIMIEDPFSKMNVASGSFLIYDIADSFRGAYGALTMCNLPLHAKFGGDEKHVEHPCLTHRPTLLTRIIYTDRAMLNHRDLVQVAARHFNRPVCDFTDSDSEPEWCAKQLQQLERDERKRKPIVATTDTRTVKIVTENDNSTSAMIATATTASRSAVDLLFRPKRKLKIRAWDIDDDDDDCCEELFPEILSCT
jgi:non-canonical poly(A) RNA polymerase PAPD5/7